MLYHSAVIRTLRRGLVALAGGVGAAVRAVVAGIGAVVETVAVEAGSDRAGNLVCAAAVASDGAVAVGGRTGHTSGRSGRRRGGGPAVVAIKRAFFGLGAALFLAAFVPSSTEAQYMGCADCAWYEPPREEDPAAHSGDGGFAYCSYDPNGRLSGCVTPERDRCRFDPWRCEEEHAVDLSGIAVNADAENQGPRSENGALRRACDSAITAWRPSQAEATQYRRKLGILVV